LIFEFSEKKKIIFYSFTFGSFSKVNHGLALILITNILSISANQFQHNAQIKVQDSKQFKFTNLMKVFASILLHQATPMPK